MASGDHSVALRDHSGLSGAKAKMRLSPYEILTCRLLAIQKARIVPGGGDKGG